MSTPRLVACPICETRTAFAPSNPWRPFCSERCKQIDLGAWASDAYRIAGRSDDGLSSDDPEHDPR